MDFLSVFKTENQRELLINLLPGCVASWPYTYLVVHQVGYDVAKTLSEWTIIPVILAFLFISWGVGFFLSDIASNIEIRLERIYFKLKVSPKEIKPAPALSPQDNLSVFLRLIFGWILIILNYWELLLGHFVPERTENKKEKKLMNQFYERWDLYLSICIPDKEPVIAKYYRGVLNRFKFELSLMAALIIMLLGHSLIFILEPSISIDWKATMIYLGLMLPALTFLFTEAFKSVELLDRLRTQLIDICKKKN